MTPVAPRIVIDVSYVKTINQSSHFAWQAQYLVKFESLFVAGAVLGNLVKFKCYFPWQVQRLVKFKCHSSWQVQYLVKFKCHTSWQVQYLVKCKCHFSWQAQHVRNVVFFNRKCSWRA